MELDGHACGNCEFYHRLKGKRAKSEGRCRRYPQTVEKRAADWCGEHSRVIVLEYVDVDEKVRPKGG